MNTILEQINSTGSVFVKFALPMLVQSTVLIVVLLLADLLLRKKVRAVFRYWLWMLVLLKLILPTTLSSPIGLGSWFGDKLVTVKLSEMNTPAEFVNLPQMIDTGTVAVTGTQQADVRPTVTRSSVAASLLVSPVPLTWQGIVFLVWAAVVSAMGLLLLQRAIFVTGLVAQAQNPPQLMNDAFQFCCRQMGIKGKVGLKVSANTTSPAVCGLFRPVILVPQNLAPTLGSSRLRPVLLHELAHIKRGDLWINLVQTILQIIYFYNPLLWLANSIIRRIREQAVDETVQVAMGANAPQYPQTLVDVAKLAFNRPVLSLRLIGVVESRSTLKGRIEKMLNRPIPKTAKLGILGLIALLIFAAVLLPMAKAKEKLQTGTDYSSVTVQEGVGFNDIIVGNPKCTGEFIKSKFGEPEEETKNKKDWWLVYHKTYGLDFWVDSQKNVLGEIRLNKGFKGKLTSGISMSSTKQKVFDAYGQPFNEEVAEDFDKRFDNQVLLFRKPAWIKRWRKPTIAKIYYNEEGLLFWFDGDKINQIVIYPPASEQELIEGKKQQPADINAKKKEILEKLVVLDEYRNRFQRDLDMTERALGEVRDRWGITDLDENIYLHPIIERFNRLQKEQDDCALEISQVKARADNLKKEAQTKQEQKYLKDTENLLVELQAKYDTLEKMRTDAAARKRDLDIARIQYKQRAAIRDERLQRLNETKSQIEKLRLAYENPEVFNTPAEIEFKSKVVAGTIDVAIEDFRINPYPAGGLYTVTVAIRNKGSQEAPPFRLNFYSGDPANNLNLHGKPQTGSHGAGPIKPGDFWNESSSPFALKEGLNEIAVVLDIDQSITESDETNNRAFMRLVVKDGNIKENSVSYSSQQKTENPEPKTDVQTDIKEAGKISDKDKMDSENLAAQGWELWRQRKLAEAEEAFKKAISKDPTNANAWNGLGWAQQNQGKPLNAKVSFEKCLEIQPKHAAALNGLGWIAKAQDKTDEAVSYWEKAIEAAPDATAALNGLATTYMELKQFDKAMKYYQMWLNVEPDSANAKAGLEKAKSEKTKGHPEQTAQEEYLLRIYKVNRSVADFPKEEDFSTPEASYAAINRVSADGEVSDWIRVSTKKLTERLKNKEEKNVDPEWAKVLLNATVLEVRILNENRAMVMAQLPQRFSSKTITNPIDVRHLELEGSRWLNAGNDRFATIEQARAKFSVLKTSE
jgi:beta-lactamase regulating signal transducer with metallopeptidase domain/Tfp pilus assembly protein PilF